MKRTGSRSSGKLGLGRKDERLQGKCEKVVRETEGERWGCSTSAVAWYGKQDTDLREEAKATESEE